jgi:hypothetical protein
LALRGTLLALRLLLAGVIWRDRPNSPNQRLGVALDLGLCVQVRPHAGRISAGRAGRFLESNAPIRNAADEQKERAAGSGTPH